jgi:hypothetical protein
VDVNIRKGFLDELRKIGGVSLSGLSAETILTQQPAPPMETPGSKKAIEVLDRAQAIKTAALSSPGMALRASQKVGQPVVNRAKNGPGIKQQIRGALTGLKGTLPPL